MVDIDSKASRVDISIYDIVNDSDTPPDGSSVADEDGGDAVESFVGDVVAEADAHFDSVGDRANEKERQGQGQGQGQDQDQDENSAEREYSCQGQSDGAADPHDSAEKGGDSCSCQGQPDDNADPHDSTEKGGDEGNDIIPLPDPDGVPSQDAESSPADVAVVENEEAFGTKKGTESLGKEFSSTWAPKHPKPINEGTTESNISRDHEYALDVDVAQAPWTRAMKAWEEKQSKQDAAIDYDTAGMEEGQKDIQSAAITVNNMNGVEPSNTAEVQQSGNNNRGPQPSIRWYNRNQGLLWKLTIAVLVVVVIILGIILGVTLGDEKSSSESSNKKLGETNEEFDKGPINTLDEADPYPPAARPYSICVAIDLSDSDKSGCAPEITCEDVTIGNRTCCGIFFDLVEGVKDTIQTLDYYVSSKHAFSVVEFTNDAALSPVPNKNTTATFSVLELSNVGNNGEPVGVYPLKQCQGDCNSDEDCEGSLSCFQRADTAVVPGCVGLGTSRYDVDYCTDLAIKGIHLVATDMLSTENVLTTLDQLTYAGRKASHAEAIDACRLSLASSSTNLNEQKFMLLITDGDPVQFSGTHQINAETAAVQAKADGVFIIPLVITNAQSWLHPDFSTYYNEGISSDGFAFLLTEYFGGGTLPQGGIYLPEEIMSRVWQLGTVDNCRERTRPDFDSLNNFCGHCLWKKSEINCFQRVKFMTTNFGGTDMSTAKKLMGAGQCIDERSKDELEEARKEGTEHWCEGCEFEGTTCESYIKQSTQGVGSTNAKKLALMKEGYCKLPPYCNTNEIWGPMETGSAVSKYCGFQQYQVSYAQCDVPCLKNSDCVRALGMGSWKCQSFDSCNDTGDNEGEELEPNQPKSELLPSPSPASDVVSENEKLVCSDTPGWADSAGDGCEWYESSDLPGCPINGDSYEGFMGIANDNCCYCAGTAVTAPVMTPPTASFPTFSPTTTRPPTTSYPTHMPWWIISSTPTPTPITHTLRHWCGQCFWKASPYHCNTRVEYLMGRYQMSEDEAKESLLKIGECMDPSSANELENNPASEAHGEHRPSTDMSTQHLDDHRCQPGMCYVAAYAACFHASSFECQYPRPAPVTPNPSESTPSPMQESVLLVQVALKNIPTDHTLSASARAAVAQFVMERLNENLRDVIEIIQIANACELNQSIPLLITVKALLYLSDFVLSYVMEVLREHEENLIRLLASLDWVAFNDASVEIDAFDLNANPCTGGS